MMAERWTTIKFILRRKRRRSNYWNNLTPPSPKERAFTCARLQWVFNMGLCLKHYAVEWSHHRKHALQMTGRLKYNIRRRNPFLPLPKGRNRTIRGFCVLLNNYLLCHFCEAERPCNVCKGWSEIQTIKLFTGLRKISSSINLLKAHQSYLKYKINYLTTLSLHLWKSCLF